MPVIAVFSGAYCSAETIADEVARRLDYTLVAQDLAQQVARRANLPENKIVRAMLGSRGWFDALSHEWEKSLSHLKAAVAEIVGTDGQILIGPAAYLIPQPITHVLRVEITADREYRIDQAAKETGATADEAARLLDQADEDLARWTSQLLGHITWDPFFHDLKFSLPDQSAEEVVEAISHTVSQKSLQPTKASRQAAQDYQLATSLQLALQDKGAYGCEVTAQQGKVTVVITPKPTPKGALARTVQSLRLDSIEQEIREICTSTPGVNSLDIRPGASLISGSWPVAEPKASPAESTTAPPDDEPVKAHEPLRVLLVDDDEELVTHLKKRLVARGLEVATALDGEEGVEAARQGIHDVAVVDLKMPGIDGIETLRQLKVVQPMLQVIMLTGCGTIDTAFEVGRLDAVQFLQKPYAFNNFLRDITAAGERKARLQRSAYARELASLTHESLSPDERAAAQEKLRDKYEQSQVD
jgi:FixJ family two-component response regulator